MSKNYRVKIHNSYRDIIAICDSDLIGRKFEEDKLQIHVKESFFNGEEMNEEQVSNIIQEGKTEDVTFNIIGENSVNIALKQGLITEEGIIKIQGIPVALVLL